MKSRLVVMRIGALGIALFALASPLFAWGEHGHEIVCEIAFPNLSNEARTEVLKLRNRAYNSFSESCLWADDIRNDRPETAPYHYINFEANKNRDELDTAEACPPEHCVTWAITHYAKIFADKAAAQKDRQEALLYVAHFVGDVHQPLHGGRGSDRGGNTITVGFLDNFLQAKLHAVWDTHLLREGAMYWPEAASTLAEAHKNQSAGWATLDPDDWTFESYLLAEEYAYRRKKNGPPILSGQKLNRGYVRRALPIVSEQLAKAGFRLAHLINEAVQGNLPDSCERHKASQTRYRRLGAFNSDSWKGLG